MSGNSGIIHRTASAATARIRCPCWVTVDHSLPGANWEKPKTDMAELLEHDVGCPYCGETITVLVDDSLAEQNYIEDCHVCCRPIVFDIGRASDDSLLVSVRSENE